MFLTFAGGNPKLTGNPKVVGSIPAGKQLFAMLVFG